MTVRDLALTDSVSIPQLGFGVFQVDPATTQQVVEQALEAGYRHIDTAKVYGNEEGVGKALAGSGVDRDDVFVTTKLWNADQGRDATLAAFDASLDRLGLEVLDLYLIHWPMPENGTFVETWSALEELRASGRVRAIGVSNFRAEDLAILESAGLSTPAINQVEAHPLLTQVSLREYHRAHGILTEAWSPLAQGQVLDLPEITGIAAAHDATPAQVVIAWHLAIGNVVIPKSVTPERIVSNHAAADIALTDNEVTLISALDRGHRVGPDPSTFHAA
ncbi:aldo/keto reductase [Aeromicrobium sp. Sec7.5]|uniref:aldo/keto reductase n=1 Tax=Aeromicrobium sp. Sec7.5 TaxID=3121276 RepID=UPI002FE43B97